jgi:ferredoxin--NADP+ reductase
MALRWCRGTIEQKQVWVDGLFTLKIAVEGIRPFEPGQFLQIGVSSGETHVHRPYSVASPFGPSIEFYVVMVEGGELTPLLWAMTPGDSIDVSERAAGSFTLSHAPRHENLWLIGTGTGLAPYIAMLRTDEPWSNYQRIILIHGTRMCADLSYADELNELARVHGPRFQYLPMTTREECPAGLSGRIPLRLEDGSIESHLGCAIQPDNSTIMLCGNPAMLDDVENLLVARGLKKHRSKSPGHIVVERYW